MEISKQKTIWYAADLQGRLNRVKRGWKMYLEDVYRTIVKE